MKDPVVWIPYIDASQDEVAQLDLINRDKMGLEWARSVLMS